MSAALSGRIRHLWRRLSNLDRAAAILALLCGLVWLGKLAGKQPPLAGLIQLLFFLAAGATAVFHLIQGRGRLLWSLRNRLVVAYLFIAVVPVLLLGTMGWLSARIVYKQFAAHLLQNDLQSRVERLRGLAGEILASLPAQREVAAPGAAGELAGSPAVQAVLTFARAEFPGLALDTALGPKVLSRNAGQRAARFAGLVQSGAEVWLVGAEAKGGRTVSLSVPLTAELLDTLIPDIGPVQVSITRPPTDRDSPNMVTSLGDLNFVSLKQIRARGRSAAPRAHWLDFEVTGIPKFRAILLPPDGAEPSDSTLLGFADTRASVLNRRLFTLPGELGKVYVQGLIALGIIFLVLEVAALRIGVKLTQTITRAVDDLYGATQHVQTGDFSHRVRVQSRDQLGVLGDSFNTMTSSINALVAEQRQRQRLENELSIAREVQSQLFPQKLPEMPGVQLAALCRAARMVSGDYYDFVQVGSNLLGMAIADISGKGISAALLMASLQAAFRSQLVLGGTPATNTAELVSRLNRHLFLNTSDDRYATLFYAVYDAATHTLHYTNAGHLPPFLVSGEQVRKLEEGGMVVGLFDECAYEQGSIRVEPGSLLVAYSDGMTEPENVYGEQFGAKRLVEEVLRYRSAAPQGLAERLLAAAEEWGQSPEQADDMTVVVARLGVRNP